MFFSNLFSRAPAIPIRVNTLGTELVEFVIDQSVTGQELFDHVTSTIGLREKWFFGLQYCDNKGLLAWLDFEHKMVNQEVPQRKYNEQNRLHFDLRVQFYPEDVTEEVIQDTTLHLFYLQVRNSILHDEIYCPPETCVLLASYALQAQYGDRNGERKPQENRLLPPRVIEQHNLTTDQWSDRIDDLWSQHFGIEKYDAMREYLKIAQDLEMYGVAYFDVANKAGTKLLLGIDAHGLNVYECNDRLNPKTGFQWSEMQSALYQKNRFIIKPLDKKSTPFVCYAERFRLAKRMLVLASGNFHHYKERRKPDSIEIQQMKVREAQKKAIKQAEREKLELAEKARKECEEKLRSVIAEMEHRQAGLMEAHEHIKQLENQLQQVQLAKDELEQRQNELQQLYHQLTESATLEAAEREKLELEVRFKREEYETAQRKIHEKDEETRRLQEEILEIRQRHDATFVVSQKADESFVSEDEEEVSGSKQEMQFNVGDYTNLSQSDDEPRQTVVSMKKDLQHQLKKLSDDLAQSADHSKVTRNDELHRENVKYGRDKYKTLRDIRHGNTLRRVDYFENM